jgi:hypothetical protein
MFVMTSLMLGAIQIATPQNSSRVMEVTPDGAFVRLADRATAPSSGSGRPAAVNSPRWQVADGGAAWIGGAVDIGDHGGAIMTGRYLNAEGLALYSSQSDQALFDISTVGSEAPYVAMADRAPVAAALVVVDQGTGSFDFEATLSVYDTTGSGTSDWTYTFPRTLNYFGGGVAVSDQAEVVLAWKADPNTGNLLIEAFDRNGVAISSGSLNDGVNFHARQARLSDDGARAYFFVGTTAFIWDVNTASVIHSQSIGASFDSHAFSGDGKSFAYGNFGFLRVVQEQGANWVQVHSESFASGTYVAYLDLNQDGSRLGFQVQRYTPAYDKIEIGMIDVPASSLMWTDSLTAPGTSFQLVCAGVELDDAGEILAGVSWGDSLNQTPECFAYDQSGLQTAALDLAGSAFSIALAPDGEVAVTGSKGVHANTFGNGGAITTFDPFEQNFHLEGVARAGNVMNMAFLNSPVLASIGFSKNLTPSSTPIGDFDIDLANLWTSATFPVPPGSGVVLLTVPPSAGLIGMAVHVQGYTGDGLGNRQITVKASTRILP